jgi:pyruvate carboxylase
MRTDLACIGRVGNSQKQTETNLLMRFLSAEADEAYVIGKRGQYTPVGAYLAGDEIIKIALQHGVQMIHPGTN